MSQADPAEPDRTNRTPWFRRRPRVTVLVAALLFLAVFGLRLAVGGVDDAITMLFVLPISLVAITFGRRAGVGSGLLAVALIVAWVLAEGYELSALGWASRIVPILLLGGLLGDATDRLRRAETQRRALDLAKMRQREAIEINDTLVQGMAAAKWSFEAGRHEAGLTTLTETIELAHGLVSNLLKDAEMGIGGHPPAPPEDDPPPVT